MAKRKSSRKTSKKITPELAKEIIAIVLIAASALLIIGFLGAGGVLTEGLINSLKLIFGALTYGLPMVFLLLAWALFVIKEDIKPINWFGFGLFLIGMAGLLHVGVESDRSLVIAQDGGGGGFIGYLLSSLFLTLLSVAASTIILLAMALIGVVLSFNLRLSELAAALFSKIRDRSKSASDFGGTIPEKNKEEDLKINAKVPLAADDTDTDAGKEEADVLTSPTDPNWKLPPLDLLEDKHGQADAGNPKQNAEIIESTLANFGIKVKMEEINIGPTVTQYTLRPDSNVKLSKITELANNLELNLAAHPIRIEAPIPGRSAVGIEVPNRKIAIVRLKEIIKSENWQKKKTPLSFSLGRDITGAATVTDLVSMPHLLIAGATGSGKSIMINSLLMSVLYRHSPADLKLILVDPKRVELKLYDNIPHLLSPVITEPEKCISALKWSVAEMERRYSVFSDMNKRNISEYNNSNKDSRMPYIMIVIDELADLMMVAPQDVEGLIVRIAQKARATGIHLVIATQRPSVNVITGLIKANITARIAFSTVSQVDSRTIIDQAGAEKLLGRGDMLFLAPDFIKPRRIQGVFISEKEVKSVTKYLQDERQPQYNDEVLTQSVKLGKRSQIGDLGDADDELIMEATRLVVESNKASASLLQRRLRIGYARAARLLDILEEKGIVSPPDGSRPREVLIENLSEVMDENEPTDQ